MMKSDGPQGENLVEIRGKTTIMVSPTISVYSNQHMMFKYLTSVNTDPIKETDPKVWDASMSTLAQLRV